MARSPCQFTIAFTAALQFCKERWPATATAELMSHFTFSPFVPKDVVATEVDFQWDSYDSYTQLGEIRQETLDFVSELSYKARIAYATSCLEWVVYFFRDLFKKGDQRPFQYLQAFWAFQMAYHPISKSGIATPTETNENEWQGAIYAPTDMSIVTVINTIYGIHDGGGGIKDASFAELIPLYILNEQSKEKFEAWRKSILQKRVRLSSVSNSLSWGDAVSREFMNPSVSISFDENTMRVNNFLREAQDSQNPLIEYYQTV